MSEKPMSPVGWRMIEDMAFTAFLGRSPDHPHVHMIVPGGGISLDGSCWVSCRPRFLLPVPVFSKLFRGLMLQKLLAAHKAGQLQFFGQHTHLAERKAFAPYLAPLRKRKWYVYSEPPFCGPKAVLAYLSRYTHNLALSNPPPHTS